MIRIELSGFNHASACGLVHNGSPPVIKLCRKLIDAGHEPSQPAEVYRGTTLCLHIRSIGEAAKLDVISGVTGKPIFVPARLHETESA
jgi:hypothetical protein